MDGMPSLFQGPPAGDDVRRCGGHDALVREVAAVGVHVSRSYQENRQAWDDQKKYNQTVDAKLSAIHTSVSALDPEVTKSRLTFQGLFVSGLVSVVVAGIANLDKIIAAIQKIQ